jgi:solute:Na+ symporter, SSS family
VDETGLSLDVGLRPLDYVAIVAYLLVTFGIALWFGRQQHNVDDFFVGGRRMPWFAVGLSILATLFSTLTYLGMPGITIKRGIGIYAGYLAVPFSMAVVTLLWIPFFMRLRLTSAYEYLELRYNSTVRLFGGTLFVFLRLGWMSMVIYAASMALNRVKGSDWAWLPGDDLYWWIALVGLVAAVYTSVGGIQAMIWTDVLQCLLLLTGVLLAIGFVVVTDGTGPIDWWQTAAQAPGRSNMPLVFSWDLTLQITVVTAMINNFFWTICTHGSDQVVLQRYFSVSSLKNARRSYFINFLVDLSMVTLLALCGLALLAFYIKHSELLPGGMKDPVAGADKLFPHFLGHQLPVGCAGLIISAFLCDAIQTLESGVNAITAVVTNDLVPKLRQGGKRWWSDLAVARGLSILITVLVTANAYFVANRVQALGDTLIEMMPKFFNMFVGPLSGMFIVGMFIPRCTARSVLPAAVLGLITSIFWSWWREIFNVEVGPTFLLAIAVPCMTTITLSAVLSLLVESGQPHPGLDYTWWSILRRPEMSDEPVGVIENGAAASSTVPVRAES